MSAHAVAADPARRDRARAPPARAASGGLVADVGCGAGAALLLLAQAFPAAELHGYELSRFALARAQSTASRRASNVRFHAVPEDAQRSPKTRASTSCSASTACTTQPERVAACDGVWLIADIKAYPTFAENVAQNPMASLMYGFSVPDVMSSAALRAGRRGPRHAPCTRRGRASSPSRRAGRFERLDVEHPVNAFYAVRPA